MALLDYQKLCPKSGRALTRDEQEALDARERRIGRTSTVRCETCGRTVELCLDPGTGRWLVYPTAKWCQARLDQWHHRR